MKSYFYGVRNLTEILLGGGSSGTISEMDIVPLWIERIFETSGETSAQEPRVAKLKLQVHFCSGECGNGMFQEGRKNH